jgi:hypothetical protein
MYAPDISTGKIARLHGRMLVFVSTASGHALSRVMNEVSTMTSIVTIITTSSSHQ